MFSAPCLSSTCNAKQIFCPLVVQFKDDCSNMWEVRTNTNSSYSNDQLRHAFNKNKSLKPLIIYRLYGQNECKIGSIVGYNTIDHLMYTNDLIILSPYSTA